MDQNGFSISNHFAIITDPGKYYIRHRLIDIITITVCAITCGAQNWIDVEQYAKSKYDWLKQFLKLPGSIHFTLSGAIGASKIVFTGSLMFHLMKISAMSEKIMLLKILQYCGISF